MKYARMDVPHTRAVVVDIDDDLAAQADALGVTLRTACRMGVLTQVRQARDIQQWRDEHREQIDAANAWVEKNGLPLAKYRLF